MTTFAADREVELSPVDAVARLVDRHGLRAVVAALAAAAALRRAAPPGTRLPALDDRLRRDIGLPPLPAPPPSPPSVPGWVRW